MTLSPADILTSRSRRITISDVRTTLTIDDDVAQEIRRRMRTGERTLKDVVNDLLRKGIAGGARPLPPQERFTVLARSAGFRPGVDPRKLNQLVDEMETEAFLERAPRGTRR